MKIGPNSTSQAKNHSSLKALIFHWMSQYALLLLGVIGLLAGFLYAWRLSPEILSNAAAQTNVPQPTPTFTAEPVSMLEIKPLPVISMKMESAMLESEKSVPARATWIMDGGTPVSIEASPLLSSDGKISEWRLIFPQSINIASLHGTQFDLVLAVNGEAISKWTYLSQLQEAGIQVPFQTVCLVSMNGSQEQAYYLIQTATQSDSPPGFKFQLPEYFFTGDATDSLLQVEETLTLQQPELDPAIRQKGLHLLAFLEKHPDEITQFLDIPLFARYFAIHDLWGIRYEEMTYFYNAKTGNLEPAIASPEQVSLSGKREEITFPFSDLALFQYPELQIAYMQALSELNTQEVYQNFKQTTFDGFHAHEKQIRLANETPYSTTWDLLDFRNTMLQLQVKPAYPIRGFVHAAAEASCISFNILNLMVSPVDVTSDQLLWRKYPDESSMVKWTGFFCLVK